ncbi:hypothetical protein PRIPAC_95554 [Pristionchus pacificus]|uniref:Uncharacterized protein n=1 Tax=Pristionchus pacificus TaxID=54126 RepID=A0A2A6BCG4_PRIPA|nr:hypothetical protein PRIPAC_95554 [Pristionchus pacificus]|eukprot:PDM63582.1 hypothetical protein PRIPAC_49555 [Pristionchus pacificus]
MMISIRSALILIFILQTVSARVVQPYKADYDDEDNIYTPEEEEEDEGNPAMGLMMQMAYNHSIPFEDLRACEKKKEAACPSPSEDGSHPCIALNDICDHRPQCPGGEDETPVICFFHEMHEMELARLRRTAIAIYRDSMNHHAPRSHGRN